MDKSIPKGKEDFKLLVELAMKAGEYTQMRPVIEKELLHYDLLFVLDKHGLLDKLTFQGGTSLRLCYGAPRLSEDLDFVGGNEFTTADLIDMKSCIERYVGERYGLEITVKEPRDLAEESRHDQHHQRLGQKDPGRAGRGLGQGSREVRHLLHRVPQATEGGRVPGLCQPGDPPGASPFQEHH